MIYHDMVYNVYSCARRGRDSIESIVFTDFFTYQYFLVIHWETQRKFNLPPQQLGGVFDVHWFSPFIFMSVPFRLDFGPNFSESWRHGQRCKCTKWQGEPQVESQGSQKSSKMLGWVASNWTKWTKKFQDSIGPFRGISWVESFGLGRRLGTWKLWFMEWYRNWMGRCATYCSTTTMSIGSWCAPEEAMEFPGRVAERSQQILWWLHCKFICIIRSRLLTFNGFFAAVSQKWALLFGVGCNEDC